MRAAARWPSRCTRGNVADSATFLPEVQLLRGSFGIEQMVLVGDRGMIGHKTIGELRRP